MSGPEAMAWADHCPDQFVEQQWLASRLREAAATWPTPERAVVIIREVLAASATDDEILCAQRIIPDWLLAH